jgi:hypothetical protein
VQYLCNVTTHLLHIGKSLLVVDSESAFFMMQEFYLRPVRLGRPL